MERTNKTAVAILPLLLLLTPAQAAAQPVPSGKMQVPPVAAGERLDDAAKRDIIAHLSDALRNRYVFPDVGIKAAALLEARLKADSYATLDNPRALAARLSDDIAGIAHDKHMRVWSMFTAPLGPSLSMIRGEGGVLRADHIAGGIGYIEVLGFPPLPAFQRALDRAMASLAGSRALIIDVRRNGGGSPKSVSYLVSYLVAPNVPINTIVSRTAKTHDFTRENISSVPTPVSFATTPVYVLTSRDTFSGGEEFAYDLQALKRAKLIGEVTGGGANPVDMTELGHGMAADIPFGRAENAVTKTNWEGRGVKPDIVVPAADALRSALAKAGGAPTATIEQASAARVFTPRSTPLPGTEQALRRVVEGYANGAPDYAIMSPDVAGEVRTSLPERRSQFAALGVLQSATFNGPDPFGGDEYRLRFAHGDVMVALVLGPQGRIAALSTPMPMPSQ